MSDIEEWHDAILALRTRQALFIGGPVRSGTTWLQLLLDAHPDVCVSGEGRFHSVLAPALRTALVTHAKATAEWSRPAGEGLPPLLPLLAEEHVRYVIGNAIALYLAVYGRRKPARVVGDKSADNALHFAELQALFPDAKFILLIRDGRDCAVSAWFHNLRRTPDWALREFGSLSAFASRFAEHWATELSIAHEFADRHGECVRIVTYESMLDDAGGVLADLLAFLGVPATGSQVAACVEAASFQTLTNGRPLGEEDRTSYFRKGVRGDWREHLDAAAQTAFTQHAGIWLARYGYA